MRTTLSPYLVLAAAAGCGARADKNPPPPVPAVAVRTAEAVEKPMPRWLVLTGSLSAERESSLAANAAGQVTSTLVERGQAVQAGQILITLDFKSAALSARAAVAQTQLAQTQADLAKTECDRAQKLLEAKAITQSDYDRRMAQCSSATSSLAAATAQRQAAAKVVSDAQVRAPFAGVVGERMVDVGQYVRPDSPVVTLFAIDPLRLELTVPEAAVADIKEGLPVEFTVAAHGDQTFAATIRYVSPNIRPSSRDLVVEAAVPNADGKLRPGMFAAARVAIGQEKRVVVPLAALKQDADQARLFVVKDGHIEERIVQVEQERGGVAAIPVGVAAGEQVVLEPSAEVKDGAPAKLEASR